MGERKRSIPTVLAGCILASTLSATIALSEPSRSSNSQMNVVQQGGVPASLQLKKPIENKLAGVEQHEYEVVIEKGQFVRLVVDQKGVDVVVRLYAPDGKKVSEVDSPNGTQGPELLVAIVEESGQYRVEVAKLAKDAPSGKYEIRLEEMRSATPEDRQLITRLAALAQAALLSNEAYDLEERGKYSDAQALYKRALAIREQVLGPEHPEVASSLANLAATYQGQGNYPEALPLFQRALSIDEKVLGPNDTEVATDLNNLAALYDLKGEYGQALPLFQRALAICEKSLPPEHPLVTRQLSNLAALYYDQGEYELALPLFQRALAIREKTLGAGHPDIANSLNNLATLYQDQGDYRRALPLLQRALAIREKALGGDHPAVATSLNNLASLYDAQGNYVHALALYTRALAIYERALGNQHPLVASALNNLALLYCAEGEFEQALPLLRRSLMIRENELGPQHPDVAVSLVTLAALYAKKGDFNAALPLYHRAVAIYEKALGSKHPNLGTTLNNLAGLYQSQGEYETALPLYQRALAIRENSLGDEHPDVADSLHNLATLYEAEGDFETSVRLQQRSAEVREKNILAILDTGSQQQKQLYLNTISSQTDDTISLHLKSAPQNSNAARLALTTILRRKGRALDAFSGQLAALRQRAAPADRALLEQLAAERAQRVSLILGGKGNSPEVKRLEADEENLEDTVSRRSSQYRAITEPITLDRVVGALPPGAALVEFVVYNPRNPQAKGTEAKYGLSRYAAYVLHRGDNVPQFADLGGAAPIDRDVDRLRAALQDPSRTDVSKLARIVDERVMLPIRKLLGKTQRIFLSPDGALNLIPFAALVDENGKYLVENYSIDYLSSGRDLLRLQAQKENRGGPVVMANPLYDLSAMSLLAETGDRPSQGDNEKVANRRSVDFTLKTYAPLPGTAEEAAALARVLSQDTQVFLGEQATEATLKQVKGPLLLHIATHGFFLPDQLPRVPGRSSMQSGTSDVLDTSVSSVFRENPLLRSGLVLAGVKQGQSGAGEDGVLTALEAAGLDLWGTKLVVLSACETGLGEVKNGAGVYGLRRALVLAGSGTQVMSLWKVSDAGTRDLMMAYYTRLHKGEERSEALRQVQLAMLQGQLKAAVSNGKRGTTDTGEKVATMDYRQPYYWAAFIQSGDWRSMDH